MQAYRVSGHLAAWFAIPVLQAQGSLFVSEDARVRSQRSLVTDLIALYKALGGGWNPTSS